MMNYWLNLNARERWTVGMGSLCLVIYLFYSFIYSPIVSNYHEKTKQLTEKKETLLWMQQVRKQPTRKKTPQTISSSKLLTLIATQLSNRPFQSFPHQIQQTSQGEIELTFDAVPYHPFLQWFWSLEDDYAIVLKQLIVEATDLSGVVKVTTIIIAK